MLDDVTRRLSSTALAGSTLCEVLPRDGGGASTWVVEIEARDLLGSWREVRDALAGVPLHPVAVTTWGQGHDWVGANLFNRFYYGTASDCSPEAVIARSQTLSVNDALRRFQEDGGDDGMPATDDPNIDLAFDWYEPRPNDPVGLVLLPIAEPCDAAAYLSFFGAEGDGRHEGLVRLMRDWQQRYGAQLVASWGTMLQFAVTSPPADPRGCPRARPPARDGRAVHDRDAGRCRPRPRSLLAPQRGLVPPRTAVSGCAARGYIAGMRPAAFPDAS